MCVSNNRLEGQWEAALDRVVELTALLGEDMADHLATVGLTRARAHVLWELRQRGPSTQRTLADAVDVTPRTMTGLIDGLVATDFVTREPHPNDRRASLVTFTAHGEATAEGLADGRREFARQLFAELPADVFASFDIGLAAVLDRLRTALNPRDPAARERADERGNEPEPGSR